MPLSHLAPGWGPMQGLVCSVVARGAKEGEESGVILHAKPMLQGFYRLPARKDFFFFFFAALNVSNWHLKAFLLSCKWGNWAPQEACYKGKDVLMFLTDVKSPGCLFGGLLS